MTSADAGGAAPEPGGPPATAVSSRPSWRRPGRVAVAAATMGSILVSLPVFLVGALAVFVRLDFPFDEAALGTAVTGYFLAFATASVPGGRLAERVGPRRALTISTLTTTCCLLGIPAFAGSARDLTLFLVLAGMSSSLAQPASALVVARAVPPGRQGLAFGTKHSAPPTASFLAGMSVPLFGLTLGWRWGFVCAALLVPVALRVYAWLPPPVPRGRPGAAAVDGVRPSLVLLVLGGALASASGSALVVFYVDSAVSGGHAPAVAGVLLGAGSLSGIGGRLFTGWLADRKDLPRQTMTAAMLSVGAAGLLLLAVPDSLVVLCAATVAAFGAGWGWQALFALAVVSARPSSPAAATGVVMAGIAGGGVVGPLIFGVVAAAHSYAHAWLLYGVAMFVAALAVAWTGRALRRADRDGAHPA